VGGGYVTYQPVANLVLTNTGTCSGATIKMDTQFSPPLKTAKALQSTTDGNRFLFEEGLKFAANTNATFTYNNALSSRIAYDFHVGSTTTGAPSGCPPITEKLIGPKSGTWSDSLRLDCTGAKELFVNTNYQMTNVYFTIWLHILGNLELNKASAHNLSWEIGLTYVLTPVLADKLTITSAHPLQGTRQDPNGIMFGSVNVSYDLGSLDSGVLLLQAYDQSGALLRSGIQKPVQRGSGTALLLAQSMTIPRAATEIRWTAELRGPPSTAPLARSQDLTYPVDADFKVDHVEAIQVVQDEVGSVPLAAGRPAWLRFHTLAAAVNNPIEAVPIQVRAFRGGVEQENSPMLLAEQGTFTSTELNRQDAKVLFQQIPVSWTAPGPLELRVEVNPPGDLHLTESNSADNSWTATLEFQERPALDLRYRIICLKGADTAPECPVGSRDGTEILHTAALFPIQGGGVSYEPLATLPKLWEQPLNTAADWDLLLQDLRAEQEVSAQAAGTATQWIGWLPAGARGSLPDGTKIMGLSWPIADGGSGRVLLASESGPADDPNREAFIVAHELGHHFGLTHQYPQPACSPEEPLHVTGEINVLYGRFYDATHYQLMSPCDYEGGISPTQFKRLWETGFLPAGAPAKSPSAASREARPAADPESVPQCVVVQGRVAREGTAGTIEQLMQTGCPEAPEPLPPSEFSLRGFDESGAKLSEWSFPVSFTLRETAAPLEDRAFTVKAPLDPRITRLAIFRTDQELAARPASANKPQLSWVAPAGGEVWSTSLQELIWSGTDADSDPLQYALQYSPDSGASWIPLAAKLAEPRLRLDTKHLLGGKQVLFRVIATDGFHSAAAQAAPVEIVQTPSAGLPSKDIDFVNVLRGHAQSRRFTIRNTGNGPLTLRVAALTGAFYLRDTQPITVPVGGARALEVQLSPPATGQYVGMLKIATNDPAQAELEIPLLGLGVDTNTPELEILTPILAFPNTAAGKTATLPLRIQNRGPAPLAVKTVTSQSPVFRLGPLNAPYTILAGAVLEIPVTFAPSAAGPVSSSLTVQSDDPKRPSADMPLQATATPAAN
jgi:hypothetical protein